MATQITGTVTRKSNGSIEIVPATGTADKQLPKMGDEVTITIEVVTPVSAPEPARVAPKKKT